MRCSAALRLLGVLLLSVGPAATSGPAVTRGSADGWPQPRPSWVWPLAPAPRVVHPFVAPASPYGPGHRGADLAASVGQRVRSAGAGVVAFAGPVAGRGVVSVVHPDARRTTYEPVDALVDRGDSVARGAVVGLVTAAPGHCLPGTCLHWGLLVEGVYRDPLGLVGRVAVRLLPLRALDRGPLLAGG